MSDPVVEAAQRAWRNWPDDVDEKLAVAAAGEMAKPIRKLHRRNSEPPGECVECGLWPCNTARLIYTPEELAE